MDTPHPTCRDLLAFVDASPTPDHAVREAARRLDAAGFAALDEAAAWSLAAGGGYYVARDGGLLAFRLGQTPLGDGGLRVLGAHTDSPTLKLKPLPDARAEGYLRLGVEVYGGMLHYTWLDRDLGLAGRVMLRAPGAALVERRLVTIARPLLRIPSLAIHLLGDYRDKGLKLDPQKHLPPVLGLEIDEDRGAGVPALQRLLATELDVEPERILSWDLSLFDVQPSAMGGLRGELVCAPRLDNLAMCHAALAALLRAGAADPTQVVCLFDHEEVGSSSTTGAGGSMATELLRRLAEVAAPGAGAGDLARAVARSYQISADMAHAVHPNHADRHEPQHKPRLNGGPVIKLNQQQRYATSAETAAIFEALCGAAGVPCQHYVHRTDLPCGTTIGPLSAARLGVRTVDVGNPMLAMHAIRETGGAEDPEHMVTVMTSFLGWSGGVA